MGQRQMGEAIPSKLCGRPFDGADLERIRREIVADVPYLNSWFFHWQQQVKSFFYEKRGHY